MERAKFWIDCLLRELLNEIDALQQESAQLLKEQVKLLREELEKLRARVREMPCGHYTPRIHDAAAEATKTLEATKEEA